MAYCRSVFLLISIYIFVFQFSTIECNPRFQRITVHGHQYTVPNEPGWEEVLREAEPIRHQLLSNCATSRECLLAAVKLREVYLKHPVSAKYYAESLGNEMPEFEGNSVFKWG